MYIIRMKIERNEYGYRDSVSIRIEYKIFPLEGYKFNARYYDAMRNWCDKRLIHFPIHKVFYVTWSTRWNRVMHRRMLMKYGNGYW